MTPQSEIMTGRVTLGRSRGHAMNAVSAGLGSSMSVGGTGGNGRRWLSLQSRRTVPSATGLLAKANQGSNAVIHANVLLQVYGDRNSARYGADGCGNLDSGRFYVLYNGRIPAVAARGYDTQTRQ
jgi:hypothetical protein